MIFFHSHAMSSSRISKNLNFDSLSQLIFIEIHHPTAAHSIADNSYFAHVIVWISFFIICCTIRGFDHFHDNENELGINFHPSHHPIRSTPHHYIRIGRALLFFITVLFCSMPSLSFLYLFVLMILFYF